MIRILDERSHAAARLHQRGAAMFAVIPITILVMSLMVAFVGTAMETSRSNVSDLDDFRARAAAQNAANIAVSDLWNGYMQAAQGNAQLWSLRAHLEGQGVTNEVVDAAMSGATQDFLAGTVAALGGQEGAGSVKVDRVSRLREIGLPTNQHGRVEIDGVEIENMTFSRIDDFESTSIIIDVDAVTRTGIDGSSRERRASIQEVFTISAPEWEGLDYALLANNVNCLLCHTEIDSAERFYNNSPALVGTFDSVKVGSLESIHFRSDPDSSVAGVMLIGADALLGDGNSITDWTQFNLRGAAAGLNGSVDKISEDAFGNARIADLELFDPLNPSNTANMFLDFYSYGSQTNYVLPSSFPSPFPDNGGLDPDTGSALPEFAGNRIVDDSEFYATVSGSVGRVSGGNISIIAKGDRITSSNDVAHMRNGSDPSLIGVTDGNVYLHGTKNDPLILDGSVAIDGDVIVSGYVVGEGTIRARGNVYIAADVQYADGGGAHRTFGKAADGSTNSLAIAAGGNIVVGDFYEPAWGKGNPADGTSEGSFNFTMDEMSIFNRMEWMKTQATLPGESEKVQTGTRDYFVDEKVKETYFVTQKNWVWVKTGNKIKKTKYKWITVSNGKSGEYESTTRVKVENGFTWVDETKRVQQGTKQVKKTRWVKTGNKIPKSDPVYEWVTPQHANPYFRPNHVARYYAFGEGTEVPIYNKEGHFDPATQHWISEEHPGAWDTSKLTVADPSDGSDPLLFDSNGNPVAVVSVIGPTADWIDHDMLKKAIQHELASQGGDKTIEIDATLYSANSILGTLPDRASSHTNGKLLVNGGIVAADVGILAPEGTQVNYDGRGARSLAITSDSGLTIRRRLTAPRRVHL